MVGLDHRSEEIRTFAIERIQALDTTNRSFTVPASFDFDAWSAGSFGVIAEPASKVRIRFDKRWASYVEEHTWHTSQQLRPGPDESVELSMEVGETADLRSWILSFGRRSPRTRLPPKGHRRGTRGVPGALLAPPAPTRSGSPRSQRVASSSSTAGRLSRSIPTSRHWPSVRSVSNPSFFRFGTTVCM